ncbi:acyloxyacyl hydrolase [Pseudomonas sp. LPB0260]|uniref:acyloxyacyl hydrolase n=1 Tax=Pseudomonas sp. LPB0260 TaxID=2614442 RepID=UPI0015C227E1|nr:acyloxyacyl hydrolase [Pseudomonas sp. LPB0260]QLC73865.1 acyloxyacyl hydrolase [Pseudomonas sp. LPB0260]QLC76639.1 acyloxyacyl hydrolase [Pseudomonas sp. LPB0260]
MKKLFALAALAAVTMGSVVSAQAADVTFSVGSTDESTMVYRLGTQFDFSSRWLESGTGHLGGYWDAGYTYWQGDESASNHSLSFSPVFVYEFAGDNVRPYIEAGIGVAFFSSTELEGSKLGSSFQFEDRLGVGLRFADQEVGLRAWHYSNAGLKEPNNGIEAYTLHYRMGF